MSEPRSYPDRLRIEPLLRPPVATVRPPGSKSITNRALILAALGAPASACRLEGVLDSEDTRYMAAALEQLGYSLTIDWQRCVLTVQQSPRSWPAQSDLFVGNSGTSMRFLTALVSLGHGEYALDGVPRMRERPIGDLIATLRSLGVDIRSVAGNDCPPVSVRASGLPGGTASIRSDVSSQFLSALLMVAPHAANALELRVEGPIVSEPYIAMTLRMLEQWGYAVDASQPRRYAFAPSLPLQLPEYRIEPDASAASYFFAAAAVCGGDVTVRGLPEGESLQGDWQFVELLEQMGCKIERSADRCRVIGGQLHGIDADMNAISDTVMTLAAVACFADGPTTIRNVAHIRHKETDRISALANELAKIGAEVTEFDDGLRIVPGPLRPASIRTYDDHRLAMSFALVGLRQPGIAIEQPGCVAKTYPGYFDDLARLAVVTPGE